MQTSETVTEDKAVRGAAVSGRIASIDISRGLTLLVMAFTDNLDFVKGLPKIPYAATQQRDGGSRA